MIHFQSYREYHSELFPETNGMEAACGPSSWWKGANCSVPQINLDPKKRPKEELTVFQGPLAERDPNKLSASEHKNGAGSTPANGSSSSMPPPVRLLRLLLSLGSFAFYYEYNFCPFLSKASSSSSTNGQTFPKPNPRPRCVVKANSVVTPPAAAATPPPTVASTKPQIAPRVRQ